MILDTCCTIAPTMNEIKTERKIPVMIVMALE
jgi:hypothetical protein